MLYHIKETIKKTKLYSIYINRKVPAYLNEELRFSINTVPDSKDALYARVRLMIHALEKTMVKGGELNQNTIFTLFSFTERLIKDHPEYPKVGDAVGETIGITRAVILFNNDRGVDCSRLKSELELFIKRNNLEQVRPRAINIHKVTLNDRPENVLSKYDAFVRNRHSVREYTTQLVDEKILTEIVQTALICPSACNRQPCKVYFSDDAEKIRHLFPDKRVTKDFYNLLIITVNKSFYSTGELFQSWIDGGIFVESLIMAIHSRGLGACLLQCPKTSRNYQSLKDSAGIPKNEDIVCCVGLGYLKDEYSIIETHRQTASEMMVKF